jgi:hypothetical protein
MKDRVIHSFEQFSEHYPQFEEMPNYGNASQIILRKQ